MTALHYSAAIGVAVVVALLLVAVSLDRTAGTSFPSAPHKGKMWNDMTLASIEDARRKGEIALAKGDHVQACVQGQIQTSGWLDLAGNLPKGSAEQKTAEKTYRKLTDAVREYCGF